MISKNLTEELRVIIKEEFQLEISSVDLGLLANDLKEIFNILIGDEKYENQINTHEILEG